MMKSVPVKTREANLSIKQEEKTSNVNFFQNGLNYCKKEKRSMKIRLIKSSCLLLCLIMLISGCSVYTGNTSFSKNAIEITPDNFLDYFDISASFDNLSSTSVPFAPALTFFNATCTMHLKCTPKSNFEIDSVTADINFKTDTLHWNEDKTTKTIIQLKKHYI